MMFTRILMPFVKLEDAVLLALLPEAGRGGGGDRDAALALLLHPVGDGGAFMDFADLVDHAGVEKNALGERGLAGVDVRGDADVARPLERDTARSGEFGLVETGSGSGGRHGAWNRCSTWRN